MLQRFFELTATTGDPCFFEDMFNQIDSFDTNDNIFTGD